MFSYSSDESIASLNGRRRIRMTRKLSRRP
jgi:hypothetical protein